MNKRPRRLRDLTEQYPDPAEIAKARKAVGLTQREASEIILHARKSWQNWETGKRPMHPAIFDYFLIRTGQAKPPKFKIFIQ